MADDEKKQRRQDRHRTLERIRRDKTQSLLSDIQAELAKYTGHKQPSDVTLNKSLSHIVANVKRIREMQEQEGGASQAAETSVSTDVAYSREVEDDDPEKLALMAVMNCGTPLVILHMHGAIMEVNDAMCEALGYETEDLKRQTVYVLTAPEDLVELMKTLCSLLAQPEGSSAHQPGVRFMHRQGHTVVFNLDINAHQQGANPCYTVWATPIDNELAKFLKDENSNVPSITPPQPTLVPAGMLGGGQQGAAGGEPRSIRPPDLTIPNYTHSQQRPVPLMGGGGMGGGMMMRTPSGGHQQLSTPASSRQWDSSGLTPLPSPTPSMVQQGMPLPSPHGGGMGGQMSGGMGGGMGGQMGGGMGGGMGGQMGGGMGGGQMSGMGGGMGGGMMTPNMQGGQQQPMPSPNYGGFMDSSMGGYGQGGGMGYGQQGGGMQWAPQHGGVSPGMQGIMPGGGMPGTPNMQMHMGMQGMQGMQYGQGYNGQGMKSGVQDSWGDPTIKEDPLLADPFM